MIYTSCQFIQFKKGVRFVKRYLFRLFVFVVVMCIFLGIFHAGSYICCIAQDLMTEFDLPVIMYHHILKEKGRQGEFIISPEEFEQDLKFIKENGYETVLPKDIIAYQENGTNLPKKPIMLTFDDGHLSYLEYAVPLLEKYEMKALVSVVGAYTNDYTDNPDKCVSYAYLSWYDIDKLSKTAHTEIGNHTYDMHKNTNGRKGCAKIKNESTEHHRKIFVSDTTKMQALIHKYTNQAPVCFTYPFGYLCKETEAEIKNLGFKMSLSCTEGINKISKNSSLFKLKRYNRRHQRSVEQILK